VSLSSRTYLLYYQREVTGNGKDKLVPLYEYFEADARELGGMRLSFHFYGWGRADLKDASREGDKVTGDLGSAYLSYVHESGIAEARLGRFFFAEGVAVDTVDGIFLKAKTPVGVGIAVYGGKPVEHSITATKTGDSLYGGRVFFVRPGFAELGASYVNERGNFQGDKRKMLGWDLWLRPVDFMELNGRASYNQATKKLADQRYVLRLHPVAGVDVSLGYDKYSNKDLFQTSLNPVFLSPVVDNLDKVRVLSAVVDWEAVKNLTLEAAYKQIHHDLSDPGNARRGEFGARYGYNDRKDTAGVSFAFVNADSDRNAYQEYRGFASHSPSGWRFALDALTQRYKEAVNGIKNAYHVVGSAGYKVLSYLQLEGDLTYTRSPRFDKDYAGLLRATLAFGTVTGGKK
jgi:hypothetical protein